jgi:hypothetical protein
MYYRYYIYDGIFTKNKPNRSGFLSVPGISPLKSPIKGIVPQFLFCHSENALLGWLGKVPAVTANLASRRCLDSSTASTTSPQEKSLPFSDFFVFHKNIRQKVFSNIVEIPGIRICDESGCIFPTDIIQSSDEFENLLD